VAGAGRILLPERSGTRYARQKAVEELIARVALGEVDTVSTSTDDAVAVFREAVVPAFRKQDGYGGCYLLLSDEGMALVISLWETDDAADAGIAGGRSVFDEQIQRFTAVYRSPPGRETYRVAVTDTPERALAG
jgi:heme-degrading monooxygenase HmoA